MLDIESMPSIIKKRWNFLSANERGILNIENIPVDALSQKYGTPFYIFIEREIRNRFRRFKKAFSYPKLKVQYACKCNSNLEILRIARDEKVELDASSVGEIMLALLADFAPEQITFTNLYKTEQDITFATKIGVRAITVDSLEELNRIERVAEKLNTKINIFLRFNPFITYLDYSSKNHQYGIPINMSEQAIEKAATSPYLNLAGFHFHGGYIKYSKIYFIAAEELIKLAVYTKEKYGIAIKNIDLGGGIPFDEQYKETFTPEDFGEEFSAFFDNLLKKYQLEPPTLIFEPGKFIVMNAGMAVMKVISRKELADKNIVVVDGSCYSVIPDRLVDNAEYNVIPATKLDDAETEILTIAGCTCDYRDIILENGRLPKLAADDIIVAMDCGAYSTVLASNFNTLKRPPVIMLKENGEQKVIRRRDRYSDIFDPELDVLKIADPNELMDLYNLFRATVKPQKQ